MARTLKSDKLLFWATLLLVGVSVVMVYSASAVQSTDAGKAPYYLLLRQLAWVVLGLGVMVVAMRVDYHVLRRPEVIWTLAGITVWPSSPCSSSRRITTRTAGSRSGRSPCSRRSSPSSRR